MHNLEPVKDVVCASEPASNKLTPIKSAKKGRKKRAIRPGQGNTSLSNVTTNRFVCKNVLSLKRDSKGKIILDLPFKSLRRHLNFEVFFNFSKKAISLLRYSHLKVFNSIMLHKLWTACCTSLFRAYLPNH